MPFSHLKELSVKDPIHTKGYSAFRCFKFVRAAHLFFFLSFPSLFFFPSTHFRLHSWEKVSKREKKNRQQSQQRDQQKDKLLLSFFSLRLACSCFPLSLCFLLFFLIISLENSPFFFFLPVFFSNLYDLFWYFSPSTFC